MYIEDWSAYTIIFGWILVNDCKIIKIQPVGSTENIVGSLDCIVDYSESTERYGVSCIGKINWRLDMEKTEPVDLLVNIEAMLGYIDEKQ